MKINDAFRLSDSERNQGAWEKVKLHAESQLAIYRITVENPRAHADDRLGAAWCISELKRLLKLAEPAKEKAEDADE